MNRSVMIDSERLRYALMGPEDADLLLALDQDPEVMRYINGGQPTTAQQMQDIYLPRLAAYTNSEYGWGMWQVRTKADDQFIGWVLVRPMHFFSDSPDWHDWELGWRLKRSAWGHGYGTEAARHIMQQLAQQPSVKYFSAIAMPGNEASIGIMKKLGMQYLKTDIHEDPLGREEVVYYQLEASTIGSGDTNGG